MRLLPRSLFGRLAILSALATAAALAIAALSIGHVLERFVLQGMDARLDAQISLVARAIDGEGRFDAERIVTLPDFDDPASGWGWRIDGPDGLRRESRGATPESALPDTPGPRGRSQRRDRPGPRPAEGFDRSGAPLHYRMLETDTTAGRYTIVAAGPRRIVSAPIREAMSPLLIALAVLGVALGIATLAQLRIGLRPLTRLRTALAEVRAGERTHVPEDQPREIAPLATELNALIDQNEASLAHARRHVANLAHGLKTPLAALSLKIAESGDGDGTLAAMVADIDVRVRHHLGRARAAAPGAAAATHIRPAIDDLIAVLARLHADRYVRSNVDAPNDLAARIDAQDLSELLGNLLDNAWRHALTQVRVSARSSGAMVEIVVEDDGPGMTDEELAEAIKPGRRLDEREDGHGFGLPIAEELAQLNGGALTLGRSSELGGLRVVIALPRVSRI